MLFRQKVSKYERNSLHLGNLTLGASLRKEFEQNLGWCSKLVKKDQGCLRSFLGS